MKDVLRYLETGEVGKQAFKPKDKGNNDVELEDDKACVCASIVLQVYIFILSINKIIPYDASSKIILLFYQARD